MSTHNRSALDPELRALLHATSTATLATLLFAQGLRTRVLAATARLRPGGPRLVGVARTLRYIAAREDLDTLENWAAPSNPQRRIAEEIEPGEVLAIEAREVRNCGTMGGMLVARMMVRGAAGIVSDGPFRDGPMIASLDFPSYANGLHPQTNLVAHHPEDLDMAITVGGVMIRPGDVLVGDDEGVVAIPRALVASVAPRAAQKEREEAWIEQQILAGASIEGSYPMSLTTRARYLAEADEQAASG